MKIGGSEKELILMFPLKKGLAKFSCNTPGLVIAWEPACRQRATVIYVWQMSIQGWGTRARTHRRKADEGTRHAVNQLDYCLQTTCFRHCCFCNKKKRYKRMTISTSVSSCYSGGREKKRLPATLRKLYRVFECLQGVTPLYQ